MEIDQRIQGTLIGTAVGDSIGLPAEGISRRRNNRLYKGHWKHRFFFGKGMLSDDTEHTLFVTQSLIHHSESSKQFQKRLASCFRWWFTALPAGIGLATLKSIMKLWIGISPTKSGVLSAGNGPAMRSSPIGAFFFRHTEKRKEFTRRSTQITHTDPKAYIGSQAVADFTAWIIRDDLSTRPSKNTFIHMLLTVDSIDKEWKGIVHSISSALDQNFSVQEFAELIGQENGISGYVFHTVPVALYAWYLHFGDFERTLISVLNCGGDTDTTGAIAGALAGTAVGVKGIPYEWVNGISDWPRNITIVKKMAQRLASKTIHPSIVTPVNYFWPGLILRNILFTIVVLLHGFRRLFPPY